MPTVLIALSNGKRGLARPVIGSQVVSTRLSVRKEWRKTEGLLSANKLLFYHPNFECRSGESSASAAVEAQEIFIAVARRH